MSPQIVSPRSLRILAAIALTLSTLGAAAQNSTPQISTTAAPPASSQAPASPQLSPGVSDVLRMSQAGVSDATVVAYVQTSERGYGGLSAPEIVYLHEAGVSSDVVNAMLDKRKRLAEANAQLAQAAQAQAAPVAPAATDATTAVATTDQYTPVYAPAPVAVTCAPPAPVSTVSVYYMPYTPMFARRTYYSGSSYRSFGTCGSGVSVTYIGGSYSRGGYRSSGSCNSFGRSGRSSFGHGR